MTELEPQGYQFKHPTRISIDGYRGIARDLMQINHQIADGFMSRSDLRGNIAIVQKPQDRALDYDQLGYIRVGKFLKLPRFEVWHQNRYVQTRKEGDTYYIAINDQELASDVARSNNGKQKFDDLYVNAFRNEVNKGLKTVLKSETLLNGGSYNYAFLVSYYEFLTKDLLLLPVAEWGFLATGSSPILDTLKVGLAYGIVNTVSNGLNIFGAYYRDFTEKMLKSKTTRSHLPTLNDPFVRHKPSEMIMPSVPVDRLAKGLIYLAKNGNKLIMSNSLVPPKKY